jgi:hypothetical protein
MRGIFGMRVNRVCRLAGCGAALLALAACGAPEQRREQASVNAERARAQGIEDALGSGAARDPDGSTLFDLFRGRAEPERQIAVNRYLWSASLDILSFLPLEGADPFSGVIATDWGRIGGDPTPVRVTVFISEAALDARSLRVAAFRQQGGRAVAVGDADNRRLEDAILTRARELRIASSRR